MVYADWSGQAAQIMFGLRPTHCHEVVMYEQPKFTQDATTVPRM